MDTKKLIYNNMAEAKFEEQLFDHDILYRSY